MKYSDLYFLRVRISEVIKSGISTRKFEQVLETINRKRSAIIKRRIDLMSFVIVSRAVGTTVGWLLVLVLIIYQYVVC
jgi:tetrahydromethanopterin S-methyltransferase subunit F